MGDRHSQPEQSATASRHFGLTATTTSQHLSTLGEWSEEQHSELVADIDREVFAAAKEAESYGTLLDGRVASARSIFEDVFKDMPEHLQRQRRQMEEEQ